MHVPAVDPLLLYIGPGAGFTVIFSFFFFFIAFLLAGVIILMTPVRLVSRMIRVNRTRRKGAFRRAVVIGLDGMSPVVARRLIDAGELPHLAQLERTGTFSPLRSTLPSVSPVAWSTFQTGTVPDKHAIFDFLAPDKKTYLPVLSSSVIAPPRRVLRLGKYNIPLGKPQISQRRKSQPFWKILGDHGVFSVVLRVPITFPPEKFNGVLLSGMCVPDLRGTQGSFTYFTTEASSNAALNGGTQVIVDRRDGQVRSAIAGPTNPLRPDTGPMEVPFTAHVSRDNKGVTLDLAGQKVTLALRSYSPWVRLTFRAGPGVAVTGICRFYLKESSPHFRLYVTPLNIDPDRPALPISHPFTYASYLSKVFGPYATLGLAEDTWAMNNGVIDDEAFLQQVYDNHEHRERLLFDSLDKIHHGMVCAVFDTTDRVQHMFWQFTQEGRRAGSRPPESAHSRAVEQCYKRMDAMMGRVISRLHRDDLLIVLSDHGFAAFHTCVNLNAWLKANGFLSLTDGEDQCKGYFENVDWSRTQAYALGLGGIYINQSGRERHGTVREGEEKQEIVRALRAALQDLRDERGRRVVSRVFDMTEHYRGPYAEDGPDLIVGFRNGYRVSWDCVTGGISKKVIEQNKEPWSADHSIDPDLVPGVLFCNRAIGRDNPGIVDIAPTVLTAFGIPIPGYMDGKSILQPDGEASDDENEREQTTEHLRSSTDRQA